MKKLLICLIAGMLLSVHPFAQSFINHNYSSVVTWKGNCTVTIIDSSKINYTKYIFDGPVELTDYINNGKNFTWPRFVPVDMSKTENDPQALLSISKQLDAQSRVWLANTSIEKNVYDGIDSGFYTCETTLKQNLKFNLTIIGDTINIVPGIEFSGFLNCPGGQTKHSSESKEYIGIPISEFALHEEIQSGGATAHSLKGKKVQQMNSLIITVEWELIPQ